MYDLQRQDPLLFISAAIKYKRARKIYL